MANNQVTTSGSNNSNNTLPIVLISILGLGGVALAIYLITKTKKDADKAKKLVIAGGPPAKTTAAKTQPKQTVVVKTQPKPTGTKPAPQTFLQKLGNMFGTAPTSTATPTYSPSATQNNTSANNNKVPFETTEEGNLFRWWVNKNYHAYAKSIGLDLRGSYNNSYVQKAWDKYGEEYNNAPVTSDIPKEFLPKIPNYNAPLPSNPASPPRMQMTPVPIFPAGDVTNAPKPVMPVTLRGEFLSAPPIPFKNATQGNKFRAWVNDNYPDYAKAMELDRTGSYNNSYIKNAWKKYGVEYLTA